MKKVPAFVTLPRLSVTPIWVSSAAKYVGACTSVGETDPLGLVCCPDPPTNPMPPGTVDETVVTNLTARMCISTLEFGRFHRKGPLTAVEVKTFGAVTTA